MSVLNQGQRIMGAEYNILWMWLICSCYNLEFDDKDN